MFISSKITVISAFSLISVYSLFGFAGPKLRAREVLPRGPTANCSIQTDSIRALPVRGQMKTFTQNSMTEKLRTMQTVMVFDHMTTKPESMLTLKPLDTVVTIQDRPEFDGRMFNYSTNETAEFYVVRVIDANAGTEMFAQATHPSAIQPGLPFITRYQHFVEIPGLGMKMALLIDERRNNNVLVSRLATLVLAADDGQASARLLCTAGAGGRFTF